MMLIAASYALCAQEVTVYRLSTTSKNPGYVVAVPPHILTTFQATYPDVTVLTWEPVTDMWRATYHNNNRITQVYYNNTGASYSVALPVIQTNVPEEVVTKAIDLYGTSLYDITMMKAADGSDVYQVRLLENSAPKSIWMDGTGTLVADTQIFKVKVDDDKIKVKAEDHQ